MNDYVNAKTIYTENYARLDFRDSMSYDLGIHSIQTALYIQDYNKNADININNIAFGYYDVHTEKMIKEFQIRNNLKPSDGVLNELTWNAIFNGLTNNKGVELLITGEQEITIVDSDEIMDNKINKGQYIVSGSENFNNNGYKNHPNGDNSKNFRSDGGYTINDDLNGENFGNESYSHIVDIGGSRFNGAIESYILGDGGYSDLGFGKYLIDGSMSSNDPNDYKTSGKKVIVPGGDSLTYGSNRWNDTSISSMNYSDYQKDYDFIYNLLGNTAYSGGGYTNKLQSSNSNTDDLGVYSGSYEKSTNKPFFNKNNIDTLRKSEFDITIVYGAKGDKTRKLIGVVPMSVSQEMNASGEPIYDIYEFVAKDVVYNND